MQTEIWLVSRPKDLPERPIRIAKINGGSNRFQMLLDGAGILEIVREAASQANRAEYAGIIDVRLRVPPNQRIYSYGVEAADIDAYLAQAGK